MILEPTIVDRAAQPYLGIKRSVTMTTIAEIADRIGDLLAHLGRRGIAAAGPPFLRYDVIDMERELIVEAGVPIAADAVAHATGPGDEPYTASLPDGRYVTARHRGHYDELVAATSSLLQWATDRSLAWDSWPTPAGDAWGCRLEEFLTNPLQEPDPNQFVTQLAFRLAVSR